MNKKKDKLWIVWVHSYYLRGRKPWEVHVNQASWVVKKITHAWNWLNERGIQMAKIMEADVFSIKEIYKRLKGD